MTGVQRLVVAGDARSCPGCGASILLGRFACATCWAKLPPPVRTAINGAWRRIIGGKGDAEASARAIADYRRATAEADALLAAGTLL